MLSHRWYKVFDDDGLRQTMLYGSWSGTITLASFCGTMQLSFAGTSTKYLLYDKKHLFPQHNSYNIATLPNLLYTQFSLHQ